MHLLKARPGVRIALVGAVAALAAAFALPFIHSNGPTSGPTTDGGTAIVHLEVARFLDRAAAAALNQSTSAPQPNQFVYSETEGPDGTFAQTWLSVDGTSPGLSQSTGGGSGPGEDEISPCSITQAEMTGCFPEAGYFPDMPIDPNDLLAYLNTIGVIDTRRRAYDS
jgi:hypothetical protein